MFYDPDKFDVVIVVLKFLAVLSSGMLTGEAFYLSRTYMPSLLAMQNADKALGRFCFLWPKGLQLYQTTLVGTFAAFAVFLLEFRGRAYWLCGALGLLAMFLYTKFYLCPRVIHFLMAPDLSKKDESYIHDMLLKFHHDHHPRTILSAISFVWLTYSLYMS